MPKPIFQKVKPVLLGASFFLITKLGFAQSAAQMPTVIPASPEVASMAKAGAISNNLFTGTASANIPLYSINSKGLKFDVALSYSSNGTRVDDLPSRVGMGWNLVAGGSVSRTIHDEPDGFYSSLSMPDHVKSGYPTDENDRSYLESITNPAMNFDTEPDEFSYSFNGMSGKFFVDAAGHGHCLPHNNLKIDVQGYSSGSYTILITTPEGTKYFFQTPEKTSTITTEGSYVNKAAAYETAWFLNRIETLDGESIDLTYTPNQITTRPGIYQTIIKSPNGALACPDGSYYEPEQISTPQVTTIKYNTYYLSSVNSSSGENIAFTYENRPGVSGDKRLKFIQVSAAGSSLFKKFGLEYTEDPDANDAGERYYLNKVKTLISGTTIPEKWIEHNLEYYNIAGLPTRLSTGQDYWGYANGKSNGTYFVPLEPSIPSSYYAAGIGGDRSASADAVGGMLKKLTYPTGGFDEFLYEPNKISTTSATTSYSYADDSGSGLNTSDPQVLTSNPFTPSQTQSASLYLRSYKNPDYPNAPDPHQQNVLDLKIIKNATGEVIFHGKHANYDEGFFSIGLDAGQTYYFQLTVWGQSTLGDAQLKYDPVTTSTTTIVPYGGMRVSETHSYDPISDKYNNHYYSYLSAVGVTNPLGLFMDAYQLARICAQGTLYANIVTSDGLIVSSNSIIPHYGYNGSPMAYQQVRESDTPDNSNGYIDHYFMVGTPEESATPLIGNYLIHGPANISTDFNGMENKTIYYKKAGSTFVKIKEEGRQYEFGPVYNSVDGYMFRRRYKYVSQSSPPAPIEFSGYDAATYRYESRWLYMSKDTTITYDVNGLNPVAVITDYEYNDVSHLLPTKITTFTSDYSYKATVNKYPVNFAASGNVYQQMLDKNIISPIIEADQFKGTTALSKTKTDYYTWSANIIKPQIINTEQLAGQATGAKPRVIFYGYDTRGNVQSVAKPNGPKVNYIYSYNGNYPIAQISNADYNTIVTLLGGATAVSNFSANATPSATDITNFLAPLRVPANLPGAQVTTYVYDPLVGITSVMDPKGQITTYEYDTFQRLLNVKDQYGNIVKHMDYHYQNQ